MRAIGSEAAAAHRRGGGRGRAKRTWCAAPGSNRAQLEALAAAGALDPLGARPAPRRALVWEAGAAAQATAERLPGVVTGAVAPTLPTPAPLEAIADDLWSLGLAPEHTAIELARPALARRGVVRAEELGTRPPGGRVTVAGVVTHRQQPETARGRCS